MHRPRHSHAWHAGFQVAQATWRHFPCCGRRIVVVITERHNAGGRWQVANGKCNDEPWGARTRTVPARWRFMACCGKEGARSMASGKWACPGKSTRQGLAIARLRAECLERGAENAVARLP